MKVGVGLVLAVLTGLAPILAAQTASATTSGTVAAKAKAPKTPYPATGYFHLGQTKGGWTLVTPQGQPFYASGVDHVTTSEDTDQATGQCPYCQTPVGPTPTRTMPLHCFSTLPGW